MIQNNFILNFNPLDIFNMSNFYDLNISENYVKEDIKLINQNGLAGICINTTDNSNKNLLISELPGLEVRHYTRITLDYSTKLSFSSVKKFQKYDLIAVKLEDSAYLKSSIEIQPDLITFNMSNNLKLKHGIVRDAINRGIFIEISIEASLKNESRMMWLFNTELILRITKGKNVIITSGAKGFGGIKKANDIQMMLENFISKKIATKIIYQNPEILLERCALKRHSFRGLVANNITKTNLKEDFILKNNRY